MDASTWHTLEDLVGKQNGPALAELLTSLISYCEVSSIEKSEVLQMVIAQNNADLLNSIAPHYDFSQDTCIQFQMALYNQQYNLLEVLNPPPRLWSDVIEELCLDQSYSCLDYWSQWAANNALDQEIASAIEVDYYYTDARDVFTNISERIQARMIHANLTETVKDKGMTKPFKKM